jgi:NAD(P)-dependent dehydrogenase (short-subunit alcohol dehydrogenase family)
MSTLTLRSQRIVVIGGSSGIGFAIAQGALAEGAVVTIGSSNAANVAAFFERIGAFDHLAYTAGDWGPLRGGGAIAQLDLTKANATFTVRFWGALAAIKHAQGHIAANGSITVTDGAIAHRPRKGAALSTAMAGAVEHLTRALAVDLAPLRVNAVCPGYIFTEVFHNVPAERLRSMTERLPLPRAGDPAEVAEAYLYLMRGGYSTGQVLVVDGGMTLI